MTDDDERAGFEKVPRPNKARTPNPFAIDALTLLVDAVPAPPTAPARRGGTGSGRRHSCAFSNAQVKTLPSALMMGGVCSINPAALLALVRRRELVVA